MVYVRTLRACKNTAGIALKSGVYADGNRNGTIVIDGLFYGLSGWNTVLASYKVPGIDFLVMCMAWVAKIIPGRVGEIGLINRPRVGLARWYLPLMIIVGPPPTAAAPTICVAGNEVLL